MSQFSRRGFALSSCLVALFTLGCGGGWSGYYIPVSTPLNPFVAPEADDLIEADSNEDVVDYEKYEDYQDEEAPAPAPVEAKP